MNMHLASLSQDLSQVDFIVGEKKGKVINGTQKLSLLYRHAVRSGNYEIYKKYAALVNDHRKKLWFT